GETLRAAPLDAILVSELPRTRQTAELVNRYHGAPILVRPELNDIRSGFEGRPVAGYFAAVGADRMNLRPPGGESLRDYQVRVLPVLDWLRERPWTTVLIVAHEETLRVLVAALRGLPAERMLELNFGNCEILEFQT
ncbi:MAG: histidine phosphatase family protein, partial [Thiohalobacteraceae bacterium]